MLPAVSGARTTESSRLVRRLGAVAALLLLSCGISGCSETRRMNVVLVTLDTTRADHLGCYGREDADTPTLDALAGDGVRFAHCMAQSGATPISHASILTGLYPFQHGVRVIYAKSGYRLADDHPYLPQILEGAGYETAAFLSSFTVSDFYGFDRGFDLFDSGLPEAADEIIEEERPGVYRWGMLANQRRSDRTTDAALEWLRERKSSDPFLLWLHYWDPHDANAAQPSTLPPPEFLKPRVVGIIPSSTEWKRAVYAAEIAYVDQQFGRIVESLRELGLYEDTVIAVVSDHGEGLEEHGWWNHRLLYEEQLHVPFLLRVPGWPQGHTVGQLVRTIDVYPTILDVLGLPSPQEVEGASLRGLVHGEAEEGRMGYADALNRFDLNSSIATQRPDDGNLYSLSDGAWKLVYRHDVPEKSELFHLADDPDESVDHYATESARAERMRQILDRYNGYRTEPFPAEGTEATSAELEALRALGYVGGENREK